MDCGQPPNIKHGKVVLLDKRTTFGGRAFYECAENYTLDGNETLSCGSKTEDLWTPKTPECLCKLSYVTFFNYKQ